ncbi:MAG: 50S ribosomal protein L15 [Anaplasmataceae bacterium]|nr:50S ribosomal protein L15 [Anaplasmataceae bacterium]
MNEITNILDDYKLNRLFKGLSSLTKKSKRVGRGSGSGCGKTSGRGHKGQKAREGVSSGKLGILGQSFLKKLPKRGFKTPLKTMKIIDIINIKDLSYFFYKNKINSDGFILDKEFFIKFSFMRKYSHGIKILSNISDKIDLPNHLIFKFGYFSKNSHAKIIENNCIIEKD